MQSKLFEAHRTQKLHPNKLRRRLCFPNRPKVCLLFLFTSIIINGFSLYDFVVFNPRKKERDLVKIGFLEFLRLGNGKEQLDFNGGFAVDERREALLAGDGSVLRRFGGPL